MGDTGTVLVHHFTKRDFGVACVCLALVVLGAIFLATSSINKDLLYVGIAFSCLALMIGVWYIGWRWCCSQKNSSTTDDISTNEGVPCHQQYCCCWMCCYANCCGSCFTSKSCEPFFRTIFCMPQSPHSDRGRSQHRRRSMTLQERRLTNATLQLQCQQQGMTVAAVQCELREMEREMQRLTRDYDYLERNAVDAQMLRSHYRSLVDQFVMLSAWIEGETVSTDQLRVAKIQLEMIRSDFDRERQQQRAINRSRASRSCEGRQTMQVGVSPDVSAGGYCGEAYDRSSTAGLLVNMPQPPPYQELDPNPDPDPSTQPYSVIVNVESVSGYRTLPIHNANCLCTNQNDTNHEHFRLPGYLTESQYSLGPPPDGHDAPPVYEDVVGTVV